MVFLEPEIASKSDGLVLKGGSPIQEETYFPPTVIYLISLFENDTNKTALKTSAKRNWRTSKDLPFIIPLGARLSAFLPLRS